VKKEGKLIKFQFLLSVSLPAPICSPSRTQSLPASCPYSTLNHCTCDEPDQHPESTNLGAATRSTDTVHLLDRTFPPIPTGFSP
jgi:hypothetical protein